MESISKDEGRTILFVSHNMPAMEKLCPTSIYLENGTVKRIGKTDEVVNEYLIATNAQ